MLALELGHHGLHHPDQLHVASGGAGCDHRGDLAGSVGVVVFAHRGNLDFGMERGLGVLLLVEDFLIELLAVAQSRDFYLNVLGTAELYHTHGEVVYLDGLAHVENEYLTTRAHRACLKDELAGLGDEHEVADDVLVRDRHRAAVLDLLLEKGDDRAV